jgi:hypothetical protein
MKFVKCFMITCLRREVCGRHMNTMYYGFSFLKTNSFSKHETVCCFQYNFVKTRISLALFVETFQVNLESILWLIWKKLKLEPRYDGFISPAAEEKSTKTTECSCKYDVIKSHAVSFLCAAWSNCLNTTSDYKFAHV